jgi:beta-1,4-mannosyl-glycoprotein beta-1,4-N-acetylglucosaminyltransferase
MRILKCTKVEHGRWHFSYLGGVTRILQKLEAFAHAKYNLFQYKNPVEIAQRIRNGLDILGRNLKFKGVPVDSSFPRHIRSHLEKYQHHLT